MNDEVTYYPPEEPKPAPFATTKGGEPLTKEQFNKLVNRYADRLKKDRKKRNKYHLTR